MAAATCAHLLRRAGFDPVIEPCTRPKLPAIMIGQATQHLMSDVLKRPDLFAGLTEIRKRVVCWGENAALVTLPHSAVIAPEQLLLDRLQLDLPAQHDGPTDWTIVASPPLPERSQIHPFGSRFASAARVNLKSHTADAACWVESVSNGWLFLLPDGSQGGWMLSVGAEPEALLAESRLVAAQIESIAKTGGRFPAHPRVIDPLCGADGWLACGSAAMGFDPLCGDGAGNATREAILASAAIQAILLEGADPNAILDHYQSRLLSGFQRHLEVCHEFYSHGGRGDWWDAEREAIREGLAWVTKRLNGQPMYRFRLNGFMLEPIR